MQTTYPPSKTVNRISNLKLRNLKGTLLFSILMFCMVLNNAFMFAQERNLITGAIVFKANLSQGHNSTEVPTTTLSSGVYAYSLVINGAVHTVQKLSVVK